MKVQVTIPDYMMLKHWKMLNNISSLEETEQMITTISAFTQIDADEVMTWSLPSVINVYSELQTVLKNTTPEFYPLVEWKGVMYGFSNMSKMSLGEYIDLDTLTKDTTGNINQILALLYRPVTKNNVQSATYITKSTLKALKYDVENVFDYYELEEYDPFARKRRAEEFNDFPIEIALGAIGFFLDIELMLLSDSQISSLEITKQIKDEKMKYKSKMRQRLQNITDGYSHSKILATPPSYQSQEINQ